MKPTFKGHGGVKRTSSFVSKARPLPIMPGYCLVCGSSNPMSFSKDYTLIRCTDCGAASGVYNPLTKQYDSILGLDKTGIVVRTREEWRHI